MINRTTRKPSVKTHDCHLPDWILLSQPSCPRQMQPGVLYLTLPSFDCLCKAHALGTCCTSKDEISLLISEHFIFWFLIAINISQFVCICAAPGRP
eukprot:1161691-Pelagomonas_calceolata.AAC.6